MGLNAARIFRAFASNQLARFAPDLYIRLTRQTGRGSSNSESSKDIADYFSECVADYFNILGVSPEDQANFVRDKVILEYGPGDLPGVALLYMALGAKKVYCVDRFALVNISAKNAAVIDLILEKLPEGQRQRLLNCFINPRDLKSGFVPERIEYLVVKNGLSGLHGEIDLTISRAVLEHVNDLAATIRDMSEAMRDGAVAVHQVDLKSHNLHRVNPLDFLEYAPWLWHLMFSHKGVPNRWRADHYRRLIAQYPFESVSFHPTALYDAQIVADAYSSLHQCYRGISSEELAWQGFWLTFRKRG